MYRGGFLYDHLIWDPLEGTPTRRPARAGLDDADRRIIELLQEDGRLSVNDLAQHVGVSRANAYQRLSRLRSGGVIKGFTVRTDPHLLGLDVAALIIVNADQRSRRELLDQVPGALRAPSTWL